MMSDGQWYSMLADGILVLHVLLVVFVIGGLLVTVIGYFRHWSWVRNPWFRFLHLAVIATVVVQTWLGASCPLTVWEDNLRRLAGKQAYGDAFIRYWLQRLIFYEADPWVFGLIYSLFGLLVLAVFVLVPPRLPGR
jgi:polyferredoxin